MLPNSYSVIINNIIHISSNLVVLQTLRAGYKTELDCDNQQEIKNFRSGSLLSKIREILDELSPYMQFLADCEKGIVPIEKKQVHHIVEMIKDLTEFYTWACEEVSLKNQRLALMQLEEKWAKESD
jgi:hypothetical protein